MIKGLAKVLLYSFEDEEGEWEQDGDDWWRWALPVYRKPQGSWGETEGFTRQKVWFINKTNSDPDINPNDISSPLWVQCYWDSQAGRWVVIKTGGGGTLCRFILLADLASGIASATIKNMAGATIDTNDILDPESIFSELTTGDTGLAIAQDGSYYVIQARCAA